MTYLRKKDRVCANSGRIAAAHPSGLANLTEQVSVGSIPDRKVTVYHARRTHLPTAGVITMDRYTSFANSSFGRSLLGSLGMPTPMVLERFDPEQKTLIDGAVLFGTTKNGAVAQAVARVLDGSRVFVYANGGSEAKRAIGNAQGWDGAPESEQKFKGLVFDASHIRTTGELKELWKFFHPVMKKLTGCSRIVVIGRPPEQCADPKQATAQRALEGLTRSTGKEVKRGGTSQLIYVAEGAEANLDSSLRFFLSPKSAYVSAQVVRIAAADAVSVDWNKPLAGKIALVTGASRGIGEAIAGVLARDGAHVICLDIPQAGAELKAVAERIGGSTLALDITDPAAPGTITDFVKKTHGGLDVLVHNAGVTRDKMLGNMTDKLWDMVIGINLSSEERINDAMVEGNAFKPNARIVCVSSISGIAGNLGQSNYAVSKAGVIGMVQSMAPVLKAKGVTINAVAPGFIETQMTAAIPFTIREAGRRMNSMSQGGLPVDVAETIAWYASPASNGVTGQVVRVCGQSLIGA
jgi:3-oxoacyl-[acyl-carrier protein] reductase